MYSFYGGRPGNSFVITTTFRSVQDMVDEFKKGPDYTAVHYDQHVMINTVNKNDPDNGKIYRRGYDFNNETTGGAEYIGTIVGPAGPAPKVSLTTIAEVKEKYHEQGIENPHSQGFYSPASRNLVPGKYEVDTGQIDQENNPITSPAYNDSIEWACCSIRDENGEDCTAFIGFVIPYMVIDFSSEQVSPYNKCSVIREDNEEHPFYENFKIKIPKGIKGESVKNLQIETVTDETNLDNYNLTVDDIGKQIITYEEYNYDEKSDPAAVKKYLGDYKTIDNIEVSDNGTLTINYTAGNPDEFTKKLKWINSVDLSDEGLFKITYNQDTESAYQKQLKWVNDIGFDEETKKLTVYYNDPNSSSKTIGDSLRGIDNIKVDDDGTLTIKYTTNDSDKFDKKLKWINSVIYDQNQLTFIYNSGDIACQIPFTTVNSIDYDEATGQFSCTMSNMITRRLGTIPFITDISLTSDGQLTFHKSDNRDITLVQKIREIREIELEDGTLKAYYNDSDTPSTVGVIETIDRIDFDDSSSKFYIVYENGNVTPADHAINYISRIALKTNGDLLIFYSDPDARVGDTESYDGVSGWINIGNVFPQDYVQQSSSINGLNWTGTGFLRNTGSEQNSKKILNFTINPTQLFKSTNVTVTGGNITVIKRGQTTPITNFSAASLSSKNPTLTKTFTGIDFEVSTEIDSDSTGLEFVDILIEGLSLSFTS